jgi:DNA-binding transcriptional MerR regulator
MNLLGVDEGTELSSIKMAELIGVPLRTVIDWAEKGVIKAEIQAASGYGSRRIFSTSDLLRAAAAKYLIRDKGIGCQVAKRWLDKWQEKPGFTATIRDGSLVISLELGFLQ